MLPTLAGVTTGTVLVRYELLDPRDGELCQKYANYRASQRDPVDRREDEGKAATIQSDLLACIAAAAWYQSPRSRIQSSVVLLSSYSRLRIDIGETGLVVSVASRKAPGIFASKESFFYEGLIDEFEATEHGHPVVSLPVVREVSRREDFTGDRVRQVLLDCVISEPDGTQGPLLTRFAEPTGVDFDLVARKVFDPDAS